MLKHATTNHSEELYNIIKNNKKKKPRHRHVHILSMKKTTYLLKLVAEERCK